MMVIPDAPVNAVNSAQTANAKTASPPGIHPTRASLKRTSSLGAGLSANT